MSKLSRQTLKIAADAVNRELLQMERLGDELREMGEISASVTLAEMADVRRQAWRDLRAALREAETSVPDRSA